MSAHPSFTMPADAHLGRLGLRVGSSDRLLALYEDVLGFDVEMRGDDAILAAGGRPLVVLHEDADASPRPDTAAGLFHLAVRVPSRAALGAVLSRIDDSAFSLTGASDHLVSEALYLRDPEGNGIEVYRDRPRAEWTMTDERVEMDTLPLDLDSLRTDASGEATLPEGTNLGHVHLEVTDLSRARAFYVDSLGLKVRTEAYSGALFVAAGDYHHHVGLNTWNRREAASGESRGLEWYEFVLPDTETLDACTAALEAEGYEPRVSEEDVAVADPDGMEVRLRVESR